MGFGVPRVAFIAGPAVSFWLLRRPSTPTTDEEDSYYYAEKNQGPKACTDANACFGSRAEPRMSVIAAGRVCLSGRRGCQR